MSDNNYNGMSLSSVLLVIFIILKLCKIIKWSWLIVLSPLWVEIIIYLIIIIIIKITDR